MLSRLYSTLCILGLLFALPLQALRLSDQFAYAHPGNWIVLSQGKLYTLLLVRATDPHTLTFEEVSFSPSGNLRPANWANWLAEGAPGHSGWVIYQIERNSGEILGFYSYTARGWCMPRQEQNLLATMATLEFQRVPDQARRRVGKGALFGGKKPLWNPPVFLEGQRREGVTFSVFRANWPKDGSPLSGQRVEVYLPNYGQGLPVYFPYWIQLDGVAGRAVVRVVDTGLQAHSPQPGFPAL